MSLWRYRRKISRAVAGELSAAQEARLREHLADCGACRDHYDALTAAERALFGAGQLPRAQAERGLARLMDELEPAPAPPRPSWRLALALAPVALALAVLGGLLRGPHQTEPDVAWRGGADAALEVPVRLLVYARDAAGTRPLRLVAELPLSGEARLPRFDLVQFAITAPQPGFATVIGEADGAVVRYFPAQAVPAAQKALPLGAPLTLGVLHPGAEQVRLKLLWSTAPLEGQGRPQVDPVLVDGVLSLAP